MTKNTGDTRFRKVDVDQYGDSAFQDDQVDDASIVTLRESELRAMMTKGQFTAALTTILQNAPISSKDQAFKDTIFKLVMQLISNIKSPDIDGFISKLDTNAMDMLMKYIYRGFDQTQEGNQALLLTWHEKVHARGKGGSIIRVLTDRRRI